jgi:hypothetical protein
MLASQQDVAGAYRVRLQLVRRGRLVGLGAGDRNQA